MAIDHESPFKERQPLRGLQPQPPRQLPLLLLPRRHPGVRHPALHGHRRRADLRHQQRPRRLPQRAAPAEAARRRLQRPSGARASLTGRRSATSSSTTRRAPPAIDKLRPARPVAE
uniref:Predicted protein n=1 Tax=Hordeum vulgare subsp. vulgare TaxID=112509 RepID=F2DMZ9_HORVV|nr:predicted protein [Hordeum vulgare subsp. vulgare]